MAAEKKVTTLSKRDFQDSAPKVKVTSPVHSGPVQRLFCAYVCECARVCACVCKRATLESENRVQLQIRVRFQFASLELGAAAESESQTTSGYLLQ